jgi:hypothetical protein
MEKTLHIEDMYIMDGSLNSQKLSLKSPYLSVSFSHSFSERPWQEIFRPLFFFTNQLFLDLLYSG